MEHIREGKHGARSAKQAIATGLSRAWRAGVKLAPPKPFGLQLPQRQIARSVRLIQSTIHDYIGRFEKSGLQWPLPEDCDEAGLPQALFGDSRKSSAAPAPRPLPDFAEVSRELTANRHTSLQLLWEEYRDRNPECITPTSVSGGATINGASARTW